MRMEDALAVHPFDGDFGTPGDRNLSDQIVRARKIHVCHWPKDECSGTGKIEKGDEYRCYVEKSGDDGKVRSYRFCPACTRRQVGS